MHRTVTCESSVGCCLWWDSFDSSSICVAVDGNKASHKCHNGHEQAMSFETGIEAMSAKPRARRSNPSSLATASDRSPSGQYGSTPDSQVPRPSHPPQGRKKVLHSRYVRVAAVVRPAVRPATSLSRALRPCFPLAKQPAEARRSSALFALARKLCSTRCSSPCVTSPCVTSPLRLVQDQHVLRLLRPPGLAGCSAAALASPTGLNGNTVEPPSAALYQAAFNSARMFTLVVDDSMMVCVCACSRSLATSTGTSVQASFLQRLLAQSHSRTSPSNAVRRSL